MNELQGGSEPRQLLGGKLWGYASGMLGQFLLTNILNSYILVYLTLAVGIDALLVSIGTALGSITNALCAPIFGYLSDVKKPTRSGKRAVFMKYGLPAVTAAFILMWFAPGWDEPSIAIFFAIFQVTFYVNFGMVRAPYLAMLQEQSEDEKNRVQISTIQGLFSILATIVGIIFPLIMQGLLEDSVDPTPDDIALLKLVIPIFGIIFAGMNALFNIIVIKSVDESFLIQKYKEPTEKLGLRDVLKNLFKPFKDSEYRKWLFSSYAMNTAMRMVVKNLTFFFTVVLLLSSAAIPVFALLAIPSAFVGFAVWSGRAKTRGLKKTFIQSTSIIFISMLATITLFLTRPIDPSTGSIFLVQIHAFIIILGVLFSLVGGYILPNPIISAHVDMIAQEKGKVEDESLSGRYFGAYLIMLNIANATGDIIVGLMLMGGNEGNWVMVLTVMPIASIAYLIAVLLLSTSKLR